MKKNILNCSLSNQSVASFLSEQATQRGDPLKMSRYLPYAHGTSLPAVTGTNWNQDLNWIAYDHKTNEIITCCIFTPTYPQGLFNQSGWRTSRTKDGVTWRDCGILITSADVTPAGAQSAGVWGGDAYEIMEEDEEATGFKAGNIVYFPTVADALSPGDGAPRIQNIGMMTAESWDDKPKDYHVIIKNPRQPVTDPVTFDFRDGHMTPDRQNKQYIMAVSVSYGVAFYVSKDLKNWSDEPVSIWTKPGAAVGDFGGVETPHLIQFNEKIWGLVYSDQVGLPKSSTDNYPEGPVIQLGAWDGKTFTASEGVAPQALGYGPDDYAVAVGKMPDGRFYMTSWVGNWQYSASPIDTPYRGFKNIQSWLSILELSEDDKSVLVHPFEVSEDCKSQKIVSQVLGGYPSYAGFGDEAPTFNPVHPVLAGNAAEQLAYFNGDFYPGQAYILKIKFSPVDGSEMPEVINVNLHDYQCQQSAQYFFNLRTSIGHYTRSTGENKPRNFQNGSVPGAWDAFYDFPLVLEEDGSVMLTAIVDTSSTEIYHGQGKGMPFRAMDFPIEHAQNIRIFVTNDGAREDAPKIVGKVQLDMKVLTLA